MNQPRGEEPAGETVEIEVAAAVAKALDDALERGGRAQAHERHEAALRAGIRRREDVQASKAA